MNNFCYLILLWLQLSHQFEKCPMRSLPNPVQGAALMTESGKTAVCGLSFQRLQLGLALICPPSCLHAAFCTALKVTLASSLQCCRYRVSQGGQVLLSPWNLHLFCSSLAKGPFCWSNTEESSGNMVKPLWAKIADNEIWGLHKSLSNCRALLWGEARNRM